jgi:hypothetical protein
MQNISAAWLYPIILIAGALQAWGPPMNNALRKFARESVAREPGLFFADSGAACLYPDVHSASVA